MKLLKALPLIIHSLMTTNSLTISSPTGTLELKYFTARGAAETSRLILALADADYKDTRYEFEVKKGPGQFSAPEFMNDKETGVLDANLGRVPILIVDGKDKIGQSRAIERYLAKRFQFMGENDVEAAKIDCIAEHCRDIKDASLKKGYTAFTKDKTEEEKAVARKEWFETDLPTMLGKLEKAIKILSKKEGFAVGSKTSYADVVIFSLICDCLPSDAEDTANSAKECVLIKSITDRISKDEKLSKWMNERPQTFM